MASTQRFGAPPRRRFARITAAAGVLACAAGAWASAPPGRHTIADGAVRDTHTGPLWQRAVSAEPFTHAAGGDHCATLDLAGRTTGWRLPTLAELLSIADRSASEPPIDSEAFPDTPPGTLWTAVPFQGPASGYWIVDFADGSTNHDTASAMHRVRCVQR